MNMPLFPDDENGEVLRRMYDGGDDLNQPRMMDFCFAFPERQQALAFAEIVDDRNLEVCISYYEERERLLCVGTWFRHIETSLLWRWDLPDKQSR